MLANDSVMVAIEIPIRLTVISPRSRSSTAWTTRGSPTRLTLHVHHYPPGTSKWNKIEHRLFCHITQNWRGRPLTSRVAVVELIAATTTKASLTVTAHSTSAPT